jgi:hypothetical protein
MEFTSSPPTSPSYISQSLHASTGGPVTAGDAISKTTGSLRPHPERLTRPGDMTVALDIISKKNKPKWHLGIRSQSKPLDIMDEVYKVSSMIRRTLNG